MSRGRVLQTGLSTQHCGRGTRFKYDPVAKLFADALTHYGYDVEHRPVIPDEDLSPYDAVLVGLGPLNGLASRFTYGGLDAISRARQSGAALMFYIDDWQTQLVRSSAQTMINHPPRLVKPLLRGARIVSDYEWASETKNLDRLTEVCHALVERRWPATIMALYDGGNWDLFRERVPTDTLVGVDPTPFYTPYDTVIPDDADRSRDWVFGILSNQTKWLDSLKLEWPLAHRGGRASRAEEGGIKEPELVQMYADSWGVLSCPYWHAGSGWFRVRHEHSAQTGSVLVSQSEELTFISDAYGVKAADVEKMSNAQLRELADAQSTAWFAQRPTKDQTAQRIGEAVAVEIAKMK